MKEFEYSVEFIDGELVIGQGSRIYVTDFQAIEAKTGAMKRYAGPWVRSQTEGMARAWCEARFPWLNVLGELKGTVPGNTPGLEGLKNYNDDKTELN
jgi:hypothetical protein